MKDFARKPTNVTVPVIICGRFYQMQFLEAGDGLKESIMVLKDATYPFWAMYPVWAWLHWVLTPDPVYRLAVWWGLN
jgi:hypothetical protein